MNETVGFNYGVFSESLKEQANKQGFELKNYEKFEKIRNAINICSFHVATESQVNAILKLHNQVVKNLIPID